MEDWMDHIKFYSVCCWALPPNDCWKHQSNDHFPSFTSERLVAPLTAPPLMDLRILLSALKCITINVIWNTQSMTCLPEDKHGQIAALQQTLRGSVYLGSIFLGENIITVQEPCSRMSSDTRSRCYCDDRCSTQMSVKLNRLECVYINKNAKQMYCTVDFHSI